MRLAEDEADAGGEKKKKTLPWFNYHVPTRNTRVKDGFKQETGNSIPALQI